MKKEKKKNISALHHLESLAKISLAIASDQYVSEILKLIVGLTAEMMNSKICSIMLLDPDKKEMTIGATQSLSQNYIAKPNIKVGQSISGKALEEHRPIKVLDVTKDINYQFPDIARIERIVSMLCVPMIVKGEPIGVINSYTSHEHDFTQEEIQLLQAVGHLAAIAIYNTRLMDETVRVKKDLETRKIVERAKGILMKENKIDEETAYRIIHKKSMDMRKSMRIIAEAILMSHDIIKGDSP